MSLTAFHVFFILVAALFCAAMSGWAFVGAGADIFGAGAKPFGAGAALVAAGLVAYGVWFVAKKSKTLEE